MHSDLPDKILINQGTLRKMLDVSRSGLDKLRKSDPTFPQPIKNSEHRQSKAFFVWDEIECWKRKRIELRDQATRSASIAPCGRENDETAS